MYTEEEKDRRRKHTLVAVVVVLLLLGIAYYVTRVMKNKPAFLKGGKWTARGGCNCVPPPS